MSLSKKKFFKFSMPRKNAFIKTAAVEKIFAVAVDFFSCFAAAAGIF